MSIQISNTATRRVADFDSRNRTSSCAFCVCLCIGAPTYGLDVWVIHRFRRRHTCCPCSHWRYKNGELGLSRASAEELKLQLDYLLEHAHHRGVVGLALRKLIGDGLLGAISSVAEFQYSCSRRNSATSWAAGAVLCCRVSS